MGDVERRRRRVRPPHSGDQPPAEAPVSPASPAGVAAMAAAGRERNAPPRRNGGGGEEAERGLRGLVGSGSSQVSVGAAMRARDAARPTDEQLADAEANLPIVRRNWTPREELPRRT